VKDYTRKQLHAELTKAIVERLEALDIGPGDQKTACRLMRALTHCLMDVAVASSASPGAVIWEVRRVLARRLPELKPAKPVLVMKPGAC
jgi:hypothetical protein